MHTGANITLPEIIYLTEGEMKDVCIRVSRDNDDNQRNITLTFSVHPFNTTSGTLNQCTYMWNKS